MSPTATNTKAAKALPPTVASSAWLPEDFWQVAVDYLVAGHDYLLILDVGWKILQSNDAFRHQIVASLEKPTASFLETITRDSSTQLLQLASEPQRETIHADLMHPGRAGTRSASYVFKLHKGCWFVVGRDQSIELELVTQMATLIGDLELRVESEKERSERLKKLSEKDPLTGLANRREFERIFAGHLTAMLELGTIFSVMSIDIDRFKLVNDEHGHLIGDEVLKRVAEILEKSLREGDCVARMGGEEFMVIASGTELKRALELAERLRREVETADMPRPAQKVTISVGVSGANPKAGGASQVAKDLIQLADAALYAAKRDGRNCVRSSE